MSGQHCGCRSRTMFHLIGTQSMQKPIEKALAEARNPQTESVALTAIHRQTIWRYVLRKKHSLLNKEVASA